MENGRIKILYVDDEKGNLTNFKFLFQDEYEIFTALSAQEGMDILHSHYCQIVISDQRMPDMSGIEFLARIASLFPDSIRILLTAFTETKDIINAINIGHVYQYITKPYQEQTVKVVLQKASESWHLRKMNQQLIVELKEKNEEYEQVNEELKQSNEELFQAKEKAEESDRLKTAFLQNMSHEIRTPMNAIMGFSELIKENLENKEKLSRFSDIINRRCNDLLDIINDLLDIAIIESGKQPVNIEDCNINELFEELSAFFTEYRNRIGKQHIKFDLQYNREVGFSIRTDKIKLKQILINLISNALKFTETGIISGGCRLINNNMLLFYISDTGIGIAPEKKELIFERFVQLNNNSNLNISGTGLGLSIVKGLLDLLHGEISFTSEPGKGSTFEFKLPYIPVQLKNSENTKSETPVLEKFFNKTVLLVEDDIYNAEYLKEVLTGSGIKILSAETGDEAIRLGLLNKIDIVLMDINLPDINGYEVIKILLDKLPYLKIIAQTAYASESDKHKALQAGCLDYISKPIKAELLLSKVKALISI